jgi:Zn-dependent oligopeptidase
METVSARPSGVRNSGQSELVSGEQETEVIPLHWTEIYPYDRLEPAHITEIVDQAIAWCDKIVEQIVATKAHTFANILEPISELHDTVFLAGGFMAQWLVNPDENLRTAAREAETRLYGYYAELFYDEAFCEKYTIFANSYEGRHLPKVGEQLSNMAEADFHFAGKRLSRVKREKLKELNRTLMEQEIAFDHNLLSDATSVELSEAELEGASDAFKETLQRDPQTGNYIVTMDYPTFFPFMRQVSSRDGRRKVSQAFFSRAGDNTKLLDKIITTRQEIVEIFGSRSWAQMNLRNSMAKSVGQIYKFYDELIEPLTAKAKEEVALMTGLMMKDGHKGPLRDYDIDYYGDQVVKLQYGIDHEKVAEYFPLDTVVNGLFDITGQLFNISYRPVDVPTWHSDVQAYAIDDNETGQQIAVFYMDLFPRDNKYQHACALSLVPGREMPGGKAYRPPVAAIIANYTPPTADKPSLLSQDERETQYHEFGHVLHACLTRARYSVMSGFNTEIDMAEVPSQTMEFWSRDPDLIVQHSRHYKTGKPMSLAMAKRLAASKNVNVALKKLDYIRKAMFDLAIHTDEAGQTVRQIWRQVSREIGVVPPQPGTYLPATFGHIASAGYAASYHGYERAMPVCADIFERFKEVGLTDPGLGMEYRRRVLEVGYRQQGADTIADFLGKVDKQPYLRSLGITAIAG